MTVNSPVLPFNSALELLGRVMPFALFFRHETHAINPVAVVKTVRLNRRIALRERRGKFHIEKWISIRRPVQRDFKHAPLLDGCFRRKQILRNQQKRPRTAPTQNISGWLSWFLKNGFQIRRVRAEISLHVAGITWRCANAR